MKFLLFRKWNFKKIVDLLDTTCDDKNLPKAVMKNWIEVWGQSENNTKPIKKLELKKPMLRADSCDFSDASIFVKGDITVTEPNNAKRSKRVAFKDNAPFINCIPKINDVQVDNKCCNTNVQFGWIQEKLKKNNRQFVEILQRWTK